MHGLLFHTPAKSAAPLRIFLSYGHDANEELVRLIKADLEKRGHDVWFDKSEIKFGDNWRRSITDGILKSNRVLSFLSKHSTRDPGVCRDEIAIAIGVKGGNIQTILVESEQEVQPPVNVGHIQWLDMHDWKERSTAGEAVWENWYQDKFSEIVRVVESDESRRFAGEIETLNTHLKPIKSEAHICQLMSKGFYGRRWLFEAVEKWRNTGLDSRLFWIMGAPGVGKSAFAAQLTQTPNATVIAAQFCEWDKSDHRNAQRVVRSLAFQLATRLPDYRKLLLTLPEITELDRKDASELFDYLLANPLKVSIAGGRERHVIVIDALDEAGEAGRNPLVEMLARNAQRLPDWLGLVVTSRPEFDVKTPLQALNPFLFDTKSESNRADIRGYLRRELAQHLQNRPDADHLVEQILEKSEGVFLYVERFCDGVQCGHLSLDHPDQFPQGLGGIFADYFKRQFPDLEKFRNDVRPALRAILAAREPLPVEILQRHFNWQDEELRDLTRPLVSLFPVTTEAGHEVIKPYHKSLADWLADEAKAGAYFVSAKEGHRLLADIGWGEYRRGCSVMSVYLLRHLPAHLAAVSRDKELRLLLSNPEFLETKCNIGMVADLVSDYELLQDSPLRIIGRALQICAQILVQYPSQLRAQLIGRLGRDNRPAIKEFLKTLFDSAKSPWLAPRLSTLASPDDGIRNSWRIFDKAKSARLIVSTDEKAIAAITHEGVYFCDTDSGSVLTPADGAKYFPNISADVLLVGVPLVDVAQAIADGKWEQRTVFGDHILSCQIKMESGYPYNNPWFDGGVFLIDKENQYDLGSPVYGTFFLNSALLAGTFTEAGKTVVCGGMNGSVDIWDMSSRRREFEGILGHDHIVSICGFPQSPLYAALTLSGSIVIGHPVKRAKEELALARGWATLHGLWLRNGDAEAIVIDKESELTLWDTFTGERLYRESVCGEAQLTSCRFTSDLRFAFVQGVNRDMYDGHMLAVHDLDKRKCIFSQESFRKAIWGVRVFRSQNKMCAAVENLEYDRGRVSRVIELESGECREAERPIDAEDVQLIETLAPPNVFAFFEVAGTGFTPPINETAKLPRNVNIVSFITQDRLSLRLPVKTSQGSFDLKFTPDGKICLAVASSTGSFIALACDSGQLHFLDIK